MRDSTISRNVGQFIAALTIALGFCADVSGIDIFDGSPKHVYVFQHWSWGLNHAFNDAAKACGVDYFTVHGPNQISRVIVGDDLVCDTSQVVGLEMSQDTPSIVIAYGGPGYPISGPEETDKINLGVTKLEILEQTLEDYGADLVLFSSHHYQWKRLRDNDPYNDMQDTLVLDAFNEKTGSIRGTNIVRMSAAASPYHFSSDFEHPNDYGDAMYGYIWLKTLYELDGKEPPASLDTWFNNQKQSAIEKMLRARMTEFIAPGDTLSFGDEITVSAEFDSSECFKVKNDDQAFWSVVLATFHGSRVFMYEMLDSLEPTSAGSVSFTIPENAYFCKYVPGSLDEYTKYPVVGDSAVVLVLADASRNFPNEYDISPTFFIPEAVGAVHNPKQLGRPSPEQPIFSRNAGSISIHYPSPYLAVLYSPSGRSVLQWNNITGQERFVSLPATTPPGAYLLQVRPHDGSKAFGTILHLDPASR